MGPARPALPFPLVDAHPGAERAYCHQKHLASAALDGCTSERIASIIRAAHSEPEAGLQGFEFEQSFDDWPSVGRTGELRPIRERGWRSRA